MRVDLKTNKAFSTEPDMCWECLSCMKACPEGAIEVRPYADISPVGSALSLKRDEQLNTITWDVKFRGGLSQTYKFPIRTTEWGSIPILTSEGRNGAGLESEELSNEPEQFLIGKAISISGAVDQNREAL